MSSSPTRGSSFFLGKVTALGVLCCFALFVCLTLLASFFLPSHLSFKNMYMYDIVHDSLLHTIFTIFLFCYRPKYPVKIHVWAGISMRGTTRLIIFDGIMDAEFYVRILEKALLPSTRKLYPGTNYLFKQDNDPKHTSRRARECFLRIMELSGGRPHQSVQI